MSSVFGERQAPQREGFALQIAAEVVFDKAVQLVFLLVVDLLNRLQQLRLVTDLLRRADQRLDIFREARTTVAAARVDEVITDA